MKNFKFYCSETGCIKNKPSGRFYSPYAVFRRNYRNEKKKILPLTMVMLLGAPAVCNLKIQLFLFWLAQHKRETNMEG